MKLRLLSLLSLIFLQGLCAQTTSISGKINECMTWKGSGSSFTINNASIANDQTLSTAEANRSANSINFNNNNSVLTFNGSTNILSLGASSTLNCPTVGGSIIDIPWNGSYCNLQEFSTICCGELYNTYSNPRHTGLHEIVIPETGTYSFYHSFRLWDNRSDCCWIADYRMVMIVKKNGTVWRREERQADRFNWGTTCSGKASHEYSILTGTYNNFKFNKGDRFYVDLIVYDTDGSWSKSGLPMATELETKWTFVGY